MFFLTTCIEYSILRIKIKDIKKISEIKISNLIIELDNNIKVKYRYKNVQITYNKFLELDLYKNFKYKNIVLDYHLSFKKNSFFKQCITYQTKFLNIKLRIKASLTELDYKIKLIIPKYKIFNIKIDINNLKASQKLETRYIDIKSIISKEGVKFKIRLKIYL
jgi:hypothetical protein